jgi:hypothetical protein
MLTAVEKSCFRNIIKISIRDKLIGGKAQFNFTNCELGYNNLSDNEKIIFLGYLEKILCEKIYKDLGNRSLIDFLNLEYKPERKFNPFSPNYGKLLRTNILNLLNSTADFRFSIQNPKKIKKATKNLNNSYLTFLGSLCNFYSEEKIYD